VTQWDESLVSAIDDRFTVYWLSTDKGYARISGRESVQCPGSIDTALLGAHTQLLDFDGGARARAGSALAGSGVQAAVIAYDADCNGNGVSDGEDIAGGDFELSGTIGQPDASTIILVGGDFELTGGFWTPLARAGPAPVTPSDLQPGDKPAEPAEHAPPP
jgi:hypothetical protein